MNNDIVLRGGPTAAFPYFKLDKIQAKPLYGCLLALECAAHVLAHIEALACRPQGSPSPPGHRAQTFAQSRFGHDH